MYYFRIMIQSLEMLSCHDKVDLAFTLSDLIYNDQNLFQFRHLLIIYDFIAFVDIRSLCLLFLAVDKHLCTCLASMTECFKSILKVFC